MFQDEMIRMQLQEQINTLFSTLLRKKNKIILWQNIDNIHRIKKSAHFKRLDIKKSELEFLPKKGVFSFDTRLPIYFFSEKRNTIFKNMIYFNNNFNMVVKVPEFIMLQNIRKSERARCNDLKVEFMFGEDNYGKDSWFKAQMLDLSKDGFSFKSNIGNIVNFKVGNRLSFKFKGMEGYALGEIVGVAKIINGDEKYNRVCVKRLEY